MNSPQTLALIRSLSGSFEVLATVKRTFSLSGPKPKLRLADEQVPIATGPRLRSADGPELDDDTDIVPTKEATDIVVRGRAYAGTDGRRDTETAAVVGVGKTIRRVRVLGERRARVDASGKVRFGAPEPFDSLELSPSLAYGGYDEQAQAALEPVDPRLEVQLQGRIKGDYAYPRNTIGRGYFIDFDRPRADDAPLPRVEDWNDAVTPERLFVPRAAAWPDAPIAAMLGWLPHSFYPRIARIAGPLFEFGHASKPIIESTFADGADLVGLPKRTPWKPDARVWQGAAPGLAAARLLGNEPVVLQSLHRAHAEIAFALPAETPQCTLDFPGAGEARVAMTLQTLRIDPDEERISLTWSGAVPTLGALLPDYLASVRMRVTYA